MPDQPMGFGPHDPDNDPLAELLAGLNADELPTDIAAMMAQLQGLMSSSGPAAGPVNWNLATTVARQVVSEGGDPSMTISDHRAVDDALRLADTWLGEQTTFPAAGALAMAWSAAEWVEGSRPVWQQVVEPVARSVAKAMAAVLAERPANTMGGMTEPAVLEQLSGTMFGLQVGQAIGTLATEIVSGTEIGLPLLDRQSVVLLPRGIASFGAGLDIDPHEIRLYLAVRESARARLFAHVPWLQNALLSAVQQYAGGINIDTERIAAALQDLDLNNPQAMQDQISEGLFAAHSSPAQQAALGRLETLLALIEGWVDVVTVAATTALPQADSLHEVVRRRRATGGPAEQTFAALVGLELRPRRLREAAALWRAVGNQSDIAARDAIWSHPDLLPTAADLDDPLGFSQRRAEQHVDSAELDAAIARLLSGEPPATEQP